MRLLRIDHTVNLTCYQFIHLTRRVRQQQKISSSSSSNVIILYTLICLIWYAVDLQLVFFMSQFIAFKPVQGVLSAIPNTIEEKKQRFRIASEFGTVKCKGKVQQKDLKQRNYRSEAKTKSLFQIPYYHISQPD